MSRKCSSKYPPWRTLGAGNLEDREFANSLLSARSKTDQLIFVTETADYSNFVCSGKGKLYFTFVYYLQVNENYFGILVVV